MIKFISNVWNYIFAPCNFLKIKNLPRSWSDRDDRYFHACYTILCEYIDEELGGRVGVASILSSIEKDISLYPAKKELEREMDILITLLDHYDWYNNINWAKYNPDDPNFPSPIEMQKRLMVLTKHRLFFWNNK